MIAKYLKSEIKGKCKVGHKYILRVKNLCISVLTNLFIPRTEIRRRDPFDFELKMFIDENSYSTLS